MKFLFVVLTIISLTQNWKIHCQRCGRPEEFGGDVRIVGGQPVGYYKYPWFAILESVGTRRQVTCGGSLVTKRHIITAAHCFKGIKTNLANVYQVSFGIYDNCIPNDPHRTIHQVESVKVHGQYAKEDPWFDIAIMTLKEDVNYEPICLPPKGGQLPPYGVVTGFGVTQEGGFTEPCLQQEVAVDIHSRVSLISYFLVI
ncbi:transmembrane protease serine 11B-like protein [Ctenocephalides felis]|uniref:transmembrane protease serine 11B-like protein n=1 Tax=Ctenocephalides felis TaxID=7515 RepID=UPI000E6E43BB|nr:transmembrane protease serine 11B-like protein [Ctenocephalides felis]